MLFAYAVQSVITVSALVLCWVWLSSGQAVAVLYGSAVALANSGLLVWRWRAGRYDYHCDGERHLRQFHRSMLERFFVVGTALALGMFGLRLDPLPVVLGFIVGQVAWLIAVAALKRD